MSAGEVVAIVGMFLVGITTRKLSDDFRVFAIVAVAYALGVLMGVT